MTVWGLITIYLGSVLEVLGSIAFAFVVIVFFLVEGREWRDRLVVVAGKATAEGNTQALTSGTGMDGGVGDDSLVNTGPATLKVAADTFADMIGASFSFAGSAPTLAGLDKANPVSMILSVAMLLQWLGERHGKASFTSAATAIERAVDNVLENPATRTADLGGTLGCKAFGAEVVRAL